jgi:hypothetical protein
MNEVLGRDAARAASSREEKREEDSRLDNIGWVNAIGKCERFLGI